jgi:hypothetical protein
MTIGLMPRERSLKMAEEDDPTTSPDDAESETLEPQESEGEQGLGTRSGAVDGPQEGGPGLGQEEGTGGKADIGESGRGRH